MRNDSYEMSVDECTRVSILILDMGRVDKNIFMDKLDKGLVPSGFDKKSGYARVSWDNDIDISKAILKTLNDNEKVLREFGNIKEDKPKSKPRKHNNVFNRNINK